MSTEEGGAASEAFKDLGRIYLENQSVVPMYVLDKDSINVLRRAKDAIDGQTKKSQKTGL